MTLEQFVKTRSMTQTEIAAKMGISRQALAQSLKSENIKFGTLRRILSAMGYSLYIGRPGEKAEKID